MRAQLEKIELIEKYLMNTLSVDDRMEFEQKMEMDNKLKTEVENQQLLMEGLKRTALKSSMDNGFKMYKLVRKMRIWGAILFMAVVSTVSYWLMKKPKIEKNSPQIEQALEITPIVEIADSSVLFNEILTNTVIEGNDDKEVKSTTRERKTRTPTYYPKVEKSTNNDVENEQIFTLKTNIDNVIESKNGIVLVVPKNAFEDTEGNVVKGIVKFKITEAFNELDVIKQGLTTTSNGELLETGGMFNLVALQNGNDLKLRKGKQILAELPNVNPDKEMMLFDGEKDSTGIVNWVNPKPFIKDLSTVNITDLDFYPSGYVGKLNLENNKISTKQFSDSMYYSFASLWGKQVKEELLWIISLEFLNGKLAKYKEDLLEEGYSMGDLGLMISKDKAVLIIASERKVKIKNLYKVNNYDKAINEISLTLGDRKIDRFVLPEKWILEFPNSISVKYMEVVNKTKEKGFVWNTKNEIKLDYKSPVRVKTKVGTRVNQGLPLVTTKIKGLEEWHSVNKYLVMNPCQPTGINPAKIKTIWNLKFNNTLLATREFEERLHLIHQARQDRILDIYIKNIDKPMFYSDSLAMERARLKYKKQFRTFYLQKKGKVKIAGGLSKKLSTYYTKKQKDETIMATMIYKDFLNKKKALTKDYLTNTKKYNKTEYDRKLKVYNIEFDINLSNIYDKNRTDTLFKKISISQRSRSSFLNRISLPSISFRNRRRNKNKEIGNRNMRRKNNSLQIRLSTMGRKNIDTYVRAINARQSINYTSPYTGKVVNLRYNPILVKIKNTEKFDKIFVYLIPKSLSSFNRMNSTDNINFSFKLNGFLKYKMICLAYKGDVPYFFEQQIVSPTNYDITLSKTMESVVKKSLNGKIGSVQKDIQSDIDFYKTKRIFTKKMSAYQRKDKLRIAIGRFLFPGIDVSCFGGGIVEGNIEDKVLEK